MKSNRSMIGGTKMHLQEIKELDKAYYMNTFGARRDVAFDHGKGITLYDTDGKMCIRDSVCPPPDETEARRAAQAIRELLRTHHKE